MKLFMLWTTFICLNGEVGIKGKHPVLSTNMYSSRLFTSMSEVNRIKDDWQKDISSSYVSCIPFMVQHEDVTNEVILKEILGLY